MARSAQCSCENYSKNWVQNSNLRYSVMNDVSKRSMTSTVRCLGLLDAAAMPREPRQEQLPADDDVNAIGKSSHEICRRRDSWQQTVLLHVTMVMCWMLMARIGQNNCKSALYESVWRAHINDVLISISWRHKKHLPKRLLKLQIHVWLTRSWSSKQTACTSMWTCLIDRWRHEAHPLRRLRKQQRLHARSRHDTALAASGNHRAKIRQMLTVHTVQRLRANGSLLRNVVSWLYVHVYMYEHVLFCLKYNIISSTRHWIQLMVIIYGWRHHGAVLVR